MTNIYSGVMMVGAQCNYDVNQYKKEKQTKGLVYIYL
jgi:hypothetical protein